MRTLLLLLVGIHFHLYALTQVQETSPVSWSFTAKKIADKTFELHFTASIDEGWHTYSQSSPKDGPTPTKISFSKNPLITFSGKIKEIGKLENKYEDVFDVVVKQYADKVDFVQVVRLKADAKTNLSGTLTFMTCNDEQCLLPKDVPFNIQIQ